MNNARYIKFYKQTVLKSLIDDHNKTKESAEELIRNSSFAELLTKDINFVGHYPPEYWAEMILEESHMMHL